MDYKFLQTLALVAWVQQEIDRTYPPQYTFFKMGHVKGRLLDIYEAATAGDHREYLRLVAGCPYEFKNRVFVDNAPADWQVTGGSKPSNQSRYWHEMSNN